MNRTSYVQLVLRFIGLTSLALIGWGSMSAPTSAQMIGPEGRVIVPERRTQQWAAWLGNRELIESTYARISQLTGSGVGAWSYEWMTVGAHFEQQARALEQTGNKRRVQDAYLKASLYYAIGYFPDNATAEQQRAYQKHLDTYLAASRFFNHAFEVQPIPFENSQIVVHLHRPNAARPPLVLFTGGTDWWKAGYHPLITQLVDRGLAVAAFDLPGTGESTAWSLGADGGSLHRRVLEFLAHTGRFDNDRIGLIGVSFGGHYAVRLAATEPRLAAVVNFCGPVQRVFHAPPEVMARVLASPEGGTIRAARRASGLDGSNPSDRQRLIDRFDLMQQGLLGGGQRIEMPILSVNGTRDRLAPIEDLELVKRSAAQGELWLLGTSGHCAGEYTRIVWPQVFDWLIEKLNRSH